MLKRLACKIRQWTKPYFLKHTEEIMLNAFEKAVQTFRTKTGSNIEIHWDEHTDISTFGTYSSQKVEISIYSKSFVPFFLETVENSNFPRLQLYYEFLFTLFHEYGHFLDHQSRKEEYTSEYSFYSGNVLDDFFFYDYEDFDFKWDLDMLSVNPTFLETFKKCLDTYTQHERFADDVAFRFMSTSCGKVCSLFTESILKPRHDHEYYNVISLNHIFETLCHSLINATHYDYDEQDLISSYTEKEIDAFLSQLEDTQVSWVSFLL